MISPHEAFLKGLDKRTSQVGLMLLESDLRVWEAAALCEMKKLIDTATVLMKIRIQNQRYQLMEELEFRPSTFEIRPELEFEGNFLTGLSWMQRVSGEWQVRSTEDIHQLIKAEPWDLREKIALFEERVQIAIQESVFLSELLSKLKEVVTAVRTRISEVPKVAV